MWMDLCRNKTKCYNLSSMSTSHHLGIDLNDQWMDYVWKGLVVMTCFSAFVLLCVGSWLKNQPV